MDRLGHRLAGRFFDLVLAAEERIGSSSRPRPGRDALTTLQGALRDDAARWDEKSLLDSEAECFAALSLITKPSRAAL